jgi:hypothetical protein
MYKDVVNQKCFFCDETIASNQKYMLGGKRLDGKGGHPERFLKDKIEHKWRYGGLSDYVDKERKVYASYNFYLCPNHQRDDDIKIAYDWAQGQINETRICLEDAEITLR